MAKEYTLQELQAMGAKPAPQEYTAEQLQQMQQNTATPTQKPIFNKPGAPVASAIGNFVTQKLFPSVGDLIQGGIPQWWKNMNDPNSQSSKNLKQATTPENLVLGFNAAPLAEGYLKGLSKVGEIAPEEELSKIQDIISPKGTAKEAKLATEQGRLVKGEPAGFWKSGTADEVLPTAKTQQASQIIQKNIPEAAKMSEPDLYKALGNKITDAAKELQPEMQKVSVSQETIDKASSNWETLKAKQIEDAPATDEPNVKKEQAKFESVVNKVANKKTPSNLDDIWNQAKAYDQSVPDKVKNATSQSSESLQDQKARWLQNRRILRNVINDASTGLGQKSQQAFSDMSAMYDAQENILTKAKIETKAPAPSTAKKILKAAGIGTGAEITKKAITGSWNPFSW